MAHIRGTTLPGHSIDSPCIFRGLSLPPKNLNFDKGVSGNSSENIQPTQVRTYSVLKSSFQKEKSFMRQEVEKTWSVS